MGDASLPASSKSNSAAATHTATATALAMAVAVAMPMAVVVVVAVAVTPVPCSQTAPAQAINLNRRPGLTAFYADHLMNSSRPAGRRDKRDDDGRRPDAERRHDTFS